ncbi:hypothetical protein ABFS82_13G151100 [Erythranthe guttata]|uniref:WRKY domain-containing protein n=1 Tax=Erythranthe guttata TaxID=4155 RepID=A0A022QM21_ERYGU|nr:PREDICTED: probable WRKY transcription factor 2 [Erythranthe guttata]EYU27515.1 hypothetical protein MIMGU_mgv1a002460mg [Erythranthe guttata]|eukprot:XP_012849048.1 PREDICTED: probable WRKY transcription factor 2 [Erythranthe guttata]
MGGFDDHIAVMGDWMLTPNPSPRGFFSSIMGDDVAITQPITNSAFEFSGPPFRGPEENVVTQASVGGDEASKSYGVGEPRSSSRGGLLERIAARAGFNAPRLDTESMIRTTDLSKKQEVQSPYLTIPPGLSPTSLLDSPVFLTNSLFLPSPTTGQFQFAASGNNPGSELMAVDSDKNKENNFENISNVPSFTFKPIAESASFSYFNATNKSFPSDGAVSNGQSKNNDELFQQFKQADFSKMQTENNGGSNLLHEQTYNSVVAADHSPPLDEQNQDGDLRSSAGDPHLGGGASEDGYSWRKYGQKQVKGSEFPRSYYKCTDQNCSVKKKVERSNEGHITEIIYKGTHNHLKPPPNRRSIIGGFSNSLGCDMQIDSEEQQPGSGGGEVGDLVWSAMQNGNDVVGPTDWKQENLETQSGAHHYEAGDGASPFTNDEEVEEERATHDAEGDELDSKRRKIEAYAPEMNVGATRAIREPRVVVQTTSEVDILDDGYRWRKYGQKVVKGNPNPRSYYKCTSAGCNVRKHVERACNDLKSVITTYEGKHNHDVPAARNSVQMNALGSGSLASTRHSPAVSNNNMNRVDPSQNRGWFERPPSASFGQPGSRPRGFGPGSGFGSMGLGGWGNNPGRLPGHRYLGNNQMLQPKDEPEMEPVRDNGFGSSAAYHQLMSRLPM